MLHSNHVFWNIFGFLKRRTFKQMNYNHKTNHFISKHLLPNVMQEPSLDSDVGYGAHVIKQRKKSVILQDDKRNGVLYNI